MGQCTRVLGKTSEKTVEISNKTTDIASFITLPEYIRINIIDERGTMCAQVSVNTEDPERSLYRDIGNGSIKMITNAEEVTVKLLEIYGG